VGLLLVLGATLNGSEGLICYEGENDVKEEVTCPSGSNGCVKLVKGTKIDRRCWKFDEKMKLCIEEVLGAVSCTSQSSKEDDTKIKSCIDKNSTAIGRKEGDDMCACFTDRCNPAGRSTPSIEVILSILVAAAVYTFNIGGGSS